MARFLPAEWRLFNICDFHLHESVRSPTADKLTIPSGEQRAERVIFDERSGVAEDRELAWTPYNLPEIEDRLAVPLQATRQALVDKRGVLCGRSTSNVAASWWQPSKTQTVSVFRKAP